MRVINRLWAGIWAILIIAYAQTQAFFLSENIRFRTKAIIVTVIVIVAVANFAPLMGQKVLVTSVTGIFKILEPVGGTIVVLVAVFLYGRSRTRRRRR